MRISAASIKHPNLPFLAALFLFCLSIAHSGMVRAVLPELPRVLLNTTYAAPVGNTITVNAGGNLQTAINNAQPGDTIVLQAGTTFTGPFTLPNKGASTQWIHIRSSGVANLPAPGNRVSPASAANMATIVGAGMPVIAVNTQDGAHHYRFIGIEFKPAAGTFSTGLIRLGSGSESSASQFPHDIVIDRCYVHGDANVGGRRGIVLNSASAAVIDSYISDWKEVGADSQAMAGWSGPGPFKIVNNYLEAAGENLMFGGSDPAISGLSPSDIEVRGNYFTKPPAWRTQTWTIKNLFELKHARRMLVEGNILDTTWYSQQDFVVNIKGADDSGKAPWTVTEDFTFRLNIVRHGPSGIKFCANACDTYPTGQGKRFLVENNLFHDINSVNWGGQGIFLQTANSVPDLVINHNTVIHDGSTFAGGDGTSPGFRFTNNIVQRGPYGFKGSGASDGTGTLNTFFPGFVFTNSLLAGATPSSYPPGNFFPVSYALVGFVDFANGDYRLGSTSAFRGVASDGKDPGVDIDALNAATACAKNGQCSSVSPPDTTPPAISSVGASSVTTTQAVIGWATNESSDSQVEYGATTAYGSLTTLNPAMVASHSQSLGNLSPSTLYHYRVRSRDANGNLGTSGDFTLNTSAVAPPVDTTPPVISAVTNAVVTTSGATVTWLTNEAADSQLEYGLTTAYGSVALLDAALVTSHVQTLSGLSNFTVYHYRVKSRDAARNLATSGDFTFTTHGSGGGDTTAPSIPTGLDLSYVSYGRKTLGWNASTDNVAVAGYRLDVSTDSAFGSFVTPYQNLNVGKVTSFTVTGLKHGTTYYFRLRAYDAAGNTSANSLTFSATA